MGPRYGCTCRTTGKVSHGHAVMISTNRDLNPENDNRNKKPIDFE